MWYAQPLPRGHRTLLNDLDHPVWHICRVPCHVAFSIKLCSRSSICWYKIFVYDIVTTRLFCCSGPRVNSGSIIRKFITVCMIWAHFIPPTHNTFSDRRFSASGVRTPCVKQFVSRLEMDMGPFFFRWPNPPTCGPNPTHDTNTRTQPNPPIIYLREMQTPML